jgi:hypothetical protein
VDIAGSRVGVFTLAAACYKTPFAPADLERRRTSRLRYRPARLTAEVLGAARGQLSAGEVLHELAASELLELFTAADLHMLRSWPVVRELRAWLRLSKRHPSYELDGLTYECLALSRVEAAALSLLLHPMVYPLVRALRVDRLLTASARAVLDGDGSVLVLEAPAVTPEDVVAHGRTLLRVWLALSSHGLYTHPLSQIIDCAATEQALSEHLSVAEGRRLLSVVRAGVSEVPARSHRLRG